MHRVLLLAVMFWVSWTGALWAQSQHEMNAEARAGFEAADKTLNTVYQKLLKTFEEPTKEKFRAAQRAWVALRDAQAEFEASMEAEGGSMYPMIYDGARARLTKAKTAEFKEMLKSGGL